MIYLHGSIFHWAEIRTEVIIFLDLMHGTLSEITWKLKHLVKTLFFCSSLSFMDIGYKQEIREWREITLFPSATSTPSQAFKHLRWLHDIFILAAHIITRLLLLKSYISLGISIWLNVNCILLVDLMLNFINFFANCVFEIAMVITRHYKENRYPSELVILKL